MKILSLTSENIKRITAVHIEPTGNVIELTGDNEAGKTSILDSIAMALEGASVIPPEPIRSGANEAKVVITLGDEKERWTVTKKFKRTETGRTVTLRVENESGFVSTSPQGILNKIVGGLSFDPMAFMSMKPEAQYESLQAFVPDVKFAEIDKLNDADYAARTVINRQAEEARVRAGAIGIGEDPFPVRVNEDAIIGELQAANDFNGGITSERSSRIYLDKESKVMVVQIEEMRLDRASMAERLAELDAAIVKRDALLTAHEFRIGNLPPLPEPRSVEEIQQRLIQARNTNRQFDQLQERKREKDRLEAAASSAAAEASLLTSNIDGRKKTKLDAVAKAKMPVKGLTFGDKAVLLDGLPISQASHARQIAVSLAIAAAMNPKLRVAFVRDGSLLDEKSWKILCQTAEKLDCQVWAETVNSGRPGAIIIEDGHIKERT